MRMIMIEDRAVSSIILLLMTDDVVGGVRNCISHFDQHIGQYN